MELTLDTATEMVGLSLSEEGKQICSLSWHAPANQSSGLATNILHLMKLAKKNLSSLKAVIVVIGPGSFNGIRAGIAMAKGLSFALGIPIVGISSLEALAFPWVKFDLPICPILQHGRELASALFIAQDGKLIKVKEEQIASLEDILSWAKEKTIFCGEISPQLELKIKDRVGNRMPVFSSLRRPDEIALLGWQKITSGQTADPFTLEPLYLLPPRITLPKGGK